MQYKVLMHTAYTPGRFRFEFLVRWWSDGILHTAGSITLSFMFFMLIYSAVFFLPSCASSAILWYYNIVHWHVTTKESGVIYFYRENCNVTYPLSVLTVKECPCGLCPLLDLLVLRFLFAYKKIIYFINVSLRNYISYAKQTFVWAFNIPHWIDNEYIILYSNEFASELE